LGWLHHNRLTVASSTNRACGPLQVGTHRGHLPIPQRQAVGRQSETTPIGPLSSFRTNIAQLVRISDSIQGRGAICYMPQGATKIFQVFSCPGIPTISPIRNTTISPTRNPTLPSDYTSSEYRYNPRIVPSIQPTQNPSYSPTSRNPTSVPSNSTSPSYLVISYHRFEGTLNSIAQTQG